MKNVFAVLLFGLFIVSMNNNSAFAQVQPEVVPEDSIYAEQGDSIIDEVVESPEDTLDHAGEELTSSEELSIKGRLQKTQNVVPLVYNTKTRSFIDYFTVRNPTYCKIMERRRNLYFPIFEAAMKRHGIPDEIKYLAVVESGLNPLAISWVGAAGLWQFMPATGRQYGLRQDEYFDERLDPYRATEAACRYLKDLYNMFHDWELALASYNCGPGNIRRAIKKSGYKNSFWGIYNYIPAETRGYVPQFVALTYTMNYLPEHNIPIDSLDYAMNFDTIVVNNYINVVRFCEKSGICIEDIKELNPALKRSEIPGYFRYALRIPRDQMSNLLARKEEILEFAALKADTPVYFVNVKKYNGSGAGNTRSSTSSSGNGTIVRTKIYHTVKRGETLSAIAGKYRVNVADIKRWNKLSSSTIRSGQKLVIYRTRVTSSTSTASTEKSGSTTATATIPANSDKVFHTVKSGESLYSIAAKYNVTVSQLKGWNKLSSSNIQAGQKLAVYKKGSASASSTSGTATPSGNIPKYYVVKNGDTLWSITQKFPGLTVDKIKKLNNLTNSSIKPGQKLVLQ